MKSIFRPTAFLSFLLLSVVFLLVPQSANASTASWNITTGPGTGIFSATKVSDNDIWGVGEDNENTGPNIVHWDGTSLSRVSAPRVHPDHTTHLYGVSAASANDIWAVGNSYPTPAIEHWDGNSWQVISHPLSSGSLAAVYAVSSNNVWAVGAGDNAAIILHWDGSSWNTVAMPSTEGGRLNGISGTGPNDIWAVGTYSPGGVEQLLTMHWNGTSWSIVSAPNPSGEASLLSVKSLATNDVWAVGGGGTNRTPFMIHWDGSNWSHTPAPNELRGALQGITAFSSNDVWAFGETREVGIALHRVGRTLVAHWDGTSWEYVPSPNTYGETNFFTTGFTIGTNELIAFGSGGEFGNLLEQGTISAGIPGSMFPVVSSINVSPISSTQVSATANFTDYDSYDIHEYSEPAFSDMMFDWGDGTTSNGTMTEASGSGTVSDTHIYAAPGTYTVKVTITGQNGGVGTRTIQYPPRQINALAPAKVWVSKGILNIGAKFDLLAEVYKDNTLVSSGQLNSFNAGSGGANQATLATIPFNTFAPVAFPAGTPLKVKVSVRNACSGSLPNSANATLWYNSAAKNSQFGATIGAVANTYFLRNAFALATTAGTSQQSVQVAAGAKCSAFKPFGTWTVTP